MKSSIGGPFNLEGLEARPMMMVDKEAHGLKAFIGLGPIVIIVLSPLRIGLGKSP